MRLAFVTCFHAIGTALITRGARLTSFDSRTFDKPYLLPYLYYLRIAQLLTTLWREIKIIGKEETKEKNFDFKETIFGMVFGSSSTSSLYPPPPSVTERNPSIAIFFFSLSHCRSATDSSDRSTVLRHPIVDDMFVSLVGDDSPVTRGRGSFLLRPVASAFHWLPPRLPTTVVRRLGRRSTS